MALWPLSVDYIAIIEELHIVMGEWCPATNSITVLLSCPLQELKDQPNTWVTREKKEEKKKDKYSY